MAVYRDPTAPGYPRQGLFEAPFSRPPRLDWLPLEVQVCAAVAWLADRWRPFAVELVRLFCGEEAVRAAGERAIGARPGLTLPRPEQSAVYPDLSLDVAGGALQLLVEVKVDADFHEHDGVLQPEAYAAAWEVVPQSPSEAAARWLGTLTRDPGTEVAAAAVPHPAVARARDVRWEEVLSVLGRLSRDGPDRWAPMAGELAAGLRRAVLQPVPEDAHPTLGWGLALLDAVVPTISSRVAECAPGSRLKPREDYVGRYLRITRGADDVQMWLMVSLGGGRYNAGRSEANVWLASRPDFENPPWLPGALEGAGFVEVHDLAGISWRLRKSVAELEARSSEGKRRAEVIGWTLRGLAQAGFTVELDG